jgi:hypothetical protein
MPLLKGVYKMGDVVRLAHFQNKDTVALLRALTIAAVNGDVLGVQMEIRMKGGRVAMAATGTYQRTPQVADGTDDCPE